VTDHGSPGPPVEGPGVVIINPEAGGGGTPLEEVEAHFPGHRVIPIGDDLGAQVHAAVDAGASFVGLAGGDGSIRAAVGALAGTGVPLLPVPCGTRNHFAGEVGVEDLEAAAELVGRGRVRAVDLGQVNGRFFVNGSHLGLYAGVVRRRRLEGHRRLKVVVAALIIGDQLIRRRTVPVEIDGDRFDAWMVAVGNGPYGAKLLELGDRGPLDGGVLDVRVVRADRALAPARALVHAFRGRMETSELAPRRLVPALDVYSPLTTVDVTLDGELVPLEPPLRFRSLPGALHVLEPDPGAGAPP
jgi:diacylglycerol kinase family enzyme